MRLGWLVSFCAHVIVACGWFIIWPHKTPSFEASVVVPVEVVTIDEKTNLPAVAPAQAEPAPEAEEKGAASSASTPEPEALEAIPEKAPLPKKEKPKNQFNTSDIEKLLLNFEKDKPGTKPKTTGQAAKKGEKPTSAFNDQSKLTASLKDAIASQFEQKRCWRATADMANPERLVVRVAVALNRDGSLRANPHVVSAVMPGDSQMQVAANNAVRAVQVCVPLKLPAESYDIWRDLELTFDGRGLIQ
ncbi:MAG: hypothetical protein ABUS57_18975 [Pseudomonadota bacterium]